MTKMILLFACVAVVVLLARTFIRDDLSPIQRGVAQELQRHGIKDVDVTKLTEAQVAELSMALTGADTNAERRAQAEAILRRARSGSDGS